VPRIPRRTSPCSSVHFLGLLRRINQNHSQDARRCGPHCPILDAIGSYTSSI
jgi:hypothetical protein